MNYVDGNGIKISENRIEQILELKELLDKGLVIGKEDVIALGICPSMVNMLINKVKQTMNVDILTVSRGRKLIGWILADEVL